MLAKIDTLAVGGDSAAVPEWRPGGNPDDLPGVVDVRDVHRLFYEALSARAWVVSIAESEEGWELELFARWKNGNVRKTPTHTLGFFHTASDASYIHNPEPSPVRTNIRPRVRPWVLRSKTFTSPRVPVIGFLRLAGLDGGEITTLLNSAPKAGT